MKKRYKKDTTHGELTLLARFSHVLSVFKNSNKKGGVKWLLGKQKLNLPVWQECDGSWFFAGYDIFELEAIGITPRDFKRICKYLKVQEPDLIQVLFKTGSLAVMGGQKKHDPPAFKLAFEGVHVDNIETKKYESSGGYVLVRSRVEGDWKWAKSRGTQCL